MSADFSPPKGLECPLTSFSELELEPFGFTRGPRTPAGRCRLRGGWGSGCKVWGTEIEELEFGIWVVRVEGKGWTVDA